MAETHYHPKKKRRKKRKVQSSHKRIRIILITAIAFILILSAAGAAFFLLRGTDPKDTLEEYTALLNAKDYKGMYALLSEESKQNISEADFTERNKNIYEGIEASGLKLQYDDEITKLDGKNQVQVNYESQMDSLAGEIKFRNMAVLNKEDGDYRIKWDSTLIFPSLQDNYRVQINVTDGVRGSIYARDGSLLAGEGIVTEAGFVPGKMQDKAAAIKQAAELLAISEETIQSNLDASYVQDDTFVPLKKFSKENTELEASLLEIPGILLQDSPARIYPLGEAAGHLTGYIQSVTAEDLEKLEEKGYHANSFIGRTGLELAFEDELRSRPGCEIAIMTEEGNLFEVVASVEKQNGKDVHTTIDAGMQKNAYDQFSSDPGTVAAMNPKTGEVLALVSTPSYDPNEFISGLSDARWKVLNEDAKKPLMNRFETTWVPGSTFKAVTAAIGVESGKLDPAVTLGYDGLSWQKDASWGDYYVTTLTDYGPETNLRNALVYSDNIYFAKAALQIGVEAQTEWFRKMGFGEEMEFPLYLGVSTYDSDTSDGELASDIQLADTGYGQGELLVNPLHLLSMYSMFVNDGNMIQPQLLELEDGQPQNWKTDVISTQTAEIVKQDLVQVIEDPTGTGASALIGGVRMLGKTGTAEIKENQDSADGVERGWFLCETIEETDRPVAVVGMVEDVKPMGGSGYVTGKVRNIVAAYYGKQ